MPRSTQLMPDRELQQLAALLQSGAHGELQQRLDERLARTPSDPEAWRLLAMLAAATGRTALALEQMAHACELAPDTPGIRFQLACLLAHAGHYASAIEHFEAVSTACPDMAEAWYFLGISLLRTRRDLDALHALRRAHGLAPDNIKHLDALAELEFRIGFPADALPLWSRLGGIRPLDLHTVLRRGECESRMSLFENAATTYRQALQTQPDSAELWMALAQAEEDNGDRRHAAEGYRQALALRPGWAAPLAGLLALERGNCPAQLLDEGSRLMHAEATTADDRALVGFALGRAYDAIGRHDDAWGCWTLANEARQRTAGGGDPAAFSKQVQQVIEEFSGTRSEAHASSGSEDDRFVFIVGMPRSGTTLTEQIIGAHPLAHACGERPDIALIVRHLPLRAASGLPPWPQMASALTPVDLQAACQRYSDPSILHAPPGAARLLDKEPLNFNHLGLIQMMYPQARIIWCRRDPRDVAVSIYGENFAPGERLATSLEGIGHYINLQARVMRHWCATLRIPVLEVRYEELVASTEEQARRMLDFLGLPWDPACLSFHSAPGGVQTPSRWQVKQPVHTRSVGRWRHYGERLAPLLETLEPTSY